MAATLAALTSAEALFGWALMLGGTGALTWLTADQLTGGFRG